MEILVPSMEAESYIISFGRLTFQLVFVKIYLLVFILTRQVFNCDTETVFNKLIKTF